MATIFKSALLSEMQYNPDNSIEIASIEARNNSPLLLIDVDNKGEIIFKESVPAMVYFNKHFCANLGNPFFRLEVKVPPHPIQPGYDLIATQYPWTTSWVHVTKFKKGDHSKGDPVAPDHVKTIEEFKKYADNSGPMDAENDLWEKGKFYTAGISIPGNDLEGLNVERAGFDRFLFAACPDFNKLKEKLLKSQSIANILKWTKEGTFKLNRPIPLHKSAELERNHYMYIALHQVFAGPNLDEMKWVGKPVSELASWIFDAHISAVNRRIDYHSKKLIKMKSGANTAEDTFHAAIEPLDEIDLHKQLIVSDLAKQWIISDIAKQSIISDIDLAKQSIISDEGYEIPEEIAIAIDFPTQLKIIRKNADGKNCVCGTCLPITSRQGITSRKTLLPDSEYLLQSDATDTCIPFSIINQATRKDKNDSDLVIIEFDKPLPNYHQPMFLTGIPIHFQGEQLVNTSAFIKQLPILFKDITAAGSPGYQCEQYPVYAIRIDEVDEEHGVISRYLILEDELALPPGTPLFAHFDGKLLFWGLILDHDKDTNISTICSADAAKLRIVNVSMREPQCWDLRQFIADNQPAM